MPKKIVPLFITILIDLIGVGIVIPVLGVLFLDPAYGLLDESTTQGTRTLLFGMLIAAYPFAQFIGAPILGAWSDRKGRKPVLVVSLIGTVIGYALFALGIYIQSLPLIFIARLLPGFTGGNISVAQSAIADLSTAETRTKNFGLIGMAFGLGLIIGPFLGGVVSDPKIVSWFDHDTPFWFACGLALINTIIVKFLFKETHIPKKEEKPPRPIEALFKGVHNIKQAWLSPQFGRLFLVAFLWMAGFSFYTQFFQLFLIERFDFTSTRIGLTLGYIGFLAAFTQGFLTNRISKRFTSYQVLRVMLLTLPLGILLLLLPKDPVFLYLYMIVGSISIGLSLPNMTSLVSDRADEQSQGKIMGVYQSVQALAQIIAPLVAGVLAGISAAVPLMVASVILLITWFIFKKTEVSIGEIIENRN